MSNLHEKDQTPAPRDRSGKFVPKPQTVKTEPGVKAEVISTPPSSNATAAKEAGIPKTETSTMPAIPEGNMSMVQLMVMMQQMQIDAQH